ncbi:MAG: LCP family protein [Lawsonibacter sp.]|nr:LCP family protein [Lawsonibacter sp.]
MRRAAWSFYKFLVFLSAVIVVIYGAGRLLIKPPPIAEDPPPAVSGPDASSGTPAAPQDPDSSGPVPVSRERRPGVYNFLLLGRDRESANTDTIIIVSYDTEAQTIGMTSIPRDTVVRRDWSKYYKVNLAYASKGPDMLKQEIKNTFGIPIDYYVHINLKGFIALVDELQGVDVYIPEDMNYDDPFQDLHIHYTKGNHHLNGQQAMEVVRFRDNNDGTGYTDVGRAEMQRQVLVNLAKKVLSWNSLTRVTAFLDIFQKYVTTDLTVDQMAWFAGKAVQFDMDSGLTQVTLEGRGDGHINGYNQWCYVFEAEDILPALNSTVNPYNQDLTAADLDLLKPERYYFDY